MQGKANKVLYKHFITIDQCHQTLKFAFHGLSVMGTGMVSLKCQKSGIKSMKECQMGSSLLDFQYCALILTSLLPLRNKSMICLRCRSTLTSLCHVSLIKKWIQKEVRFDLKKRSGFSEILDGLLFHDSTKLKV